MIILVGGEKGGVGKSCVAQTMAVDLAMRHGKEVIMLDADPQGTTSDWYSERKENEALDDLIQCVKVSGDIRREVKSLSAKYEVLIIDAGGQDSDAFRSGLVVATHLLIPFRPKRRDLKTLPNISKLISFGLIENPNLKVRAIINQCPSLPSQHTRILDAKAVCSSFDIEPLMTVIFHRNAFDDAEEGGGTVFECGNRDEKAADEVRKMVDEFLFDERVYQ